MYINCSGNWERPEIEIADSAQSFNKLGKLLVNIDDNLKIYTNQEKGGPYPEALEALVIRLLEEDDLQQLDVLKIFVEDKNLVIESPKSGFDKLGASLTSFEDAKKHDHFHLDYWEGNGLLAPTNCSLIFMCLGQDN